MDRYEKFRMVFDVVIMVIALVVIIRAVVA